MQYRSTKEQVHISQCILNKLVIICSDMLPFICSMKADQFNGLFYLTVSCAVKRLCSSALVSGLSTSHVRPLQRNKTETTPSLLNDVPTGKILHTSNVHDVEGHSSVHIIMLFIPDVRRHYLINAPLVVFRQLSI